MSTIDQTLEMERRYHCRYESGPHLTFPVTHRLDGRPMPYTDGGVAAWAHIGIGNLEHVQWAILDTSGRQLIHGAERNLGRTRAGYVAMLRRALKHVRAYGAQRVRVRDAANRPPVAGANPWTRFGGAL